jgi:hypothetical protein
MNHRYYFAFVCHPARLCFTAISEQFLLDADTAAGLAVAKSLAIDLTANHAAARLSQYTWAETATIINT